MPRYTKKDKDGRYYIESINGRLESDKFGHTYGEAIDRFAELENADVVPRAEVEKVFEEMETSLYYKLIDGEIHLIIREEDYKELKKKYTKG